MRTSRLAATATLFVLTGGVLAGGTSPATAADGSASPSASATAGPTAGATPGATATTTTPTPSTGGPTPTASATVTPSATGTPSATATPTDPAPGTATATPSATSTLPADCESEYQVTMPVHAVPTAATLVRGGPPQDLAFSFYNSSDTVLTDFRISYRIEGPQGGAPFKPLVRIQGGPFTPVEPNDGTGTTAVGSFRVPAHEMVTAELRFADEPGTVSGDYAVTVAGSSEVLPYGVGPVNVKYRCNRLLGSLTSTLTRTEPAPATTAPSTSASPTATETATPTTSASPDASPSAPATTSGTPGTSGTDNGDPAGPRLAGTGASSGNVPLAVTGGMAIVLGLAAVVVARRRNRAAAASTAAPTTRG
ncbi:hypothetical protein SAMN05216371_4146 [Streptomyces sp. TLI_053]|uniref:hypothetical protein n=1 Tax=Streptomyces sp. TLI_053 TaxID=1855352 RepID=UPI000879AFD8|nr:hypothetical protein [Streptomyces sp. TLI_053]SDT71568.1 hypothetical protein SAMN05216371_4146 [Streptomyces sp. TLI_053]